MFTELFRFVCRTGLAAGLIWALMAPHAAPAATTKPITRERKAKSATPAKKVVPPKVTSTTIELVPSEAASRVLAWVATAHDNGRLPYAVIDKQTASLFLFKANGEPIGQAPVLLGVGVGDDSSPGVGAKTLAEIGPAERTTPAGRFVAKFGRAFGRQRVLWVDYANSVALHAVITTNKKERRVERLLSPTAEDNRITFGCINVGTSFYTSKLRPVFQNKGGIVYILPDTKSVDDVFPRARLLPYLEAASRE